MEHHHERSHPASLSEAQDSWPKRREHQVLRLCVSMFRTDHRKGKPWTLGCKFCPRVESHKGLENIHIKSVGHVLKKWDVIIFIQKSLGICSDVVDLLRLQAVFSRGGDDLTNHMVLCLETLFCKAMWVNEVMQSLQLELHVRQLVAAMVKPSYRMKWLQSQSLIFLHVWVDHLSWNRTSFITEDPFLARYVS